jgi:hypothetical protein
VTAAPNSGLNQEWLGCLNRIIACAEGIAETARIKDDRARRPQLLAACLLARSISIAQAVVHLIGLNHVVEARMLARSIFENEFYLYRLAQDDGRAFAREMRVDEAHHYRAGMEAFKTTLETKEGRSLVQKIIDWSLQKNPKAKKPFGPKSAISGTDFEVAYGVSYKHYVFYKQLSFDAGHPSITALKRHCVQSAKTLSLKPQLRDEEAINTAFLASMALLGGCIAANTAFGGTAGGERLEGAMAEYFEIGARTHRVRIAISQAAFDAIAKTPLLGSVGFENKVNEKGKRLIWLDSAVLARLRSLRGPGESYSGVILRLAVKPHIWLLPQQ